MKGFDSATPISGEAAKWLYANGYGVAFRYFSRNPSKNLSRAEAQALSDAGIFIGSVFEDRNDEYSYFTSAQGAADAVLAAEQAKACGQPLGTVVYTTYDFDATQQQIDGGISDYALSFKTMLNGQGYLAGSYGSPLVNACLAAKGYTARSWEAQSTGWAGDHSAPADIQQGREVTLDGIDVDLDTTSETAQWIGAWSLPPAAPVQPPSPQPVPDYSGDNDRRLQAILIASGYSCGSDGADGRWGGDSEAAWQAWRAGQ